MMKTKILPLLVLSMVLLAVSLSLHAQPAGSRFRQKSGRSQVHQPSKSGDPRFDLAWKQADSLMNLGQPQSALAVVGKIFILAKKENNEPQVVKSVLYQIRLNSDFQENFLQKSILSQKKDISHSSWTTRQILQSVLAEVYWKYYQNNQFRFRDRTPVTPVVSDSIATWDLATISAAITRNYLWSLQHADSLKNIPIGRFDAIVNCDPVDDKNQAAQAAAAAKFYPTLYDFLASRALDFFTSNQGILHASGKPVPADSPDFYAPTTGFIRLTVTIPGDSLSLKSFALRLFRDLAIFHAPDKDPRALIETELKRLAYVHDASTLPGNDSLYADALRKFETLQGDSPWSTRVSFALANFLNQQGQGYDPFVAGPHKWEIRSALAVCDLAIKRFPDAAGSKDCKILVRSIHEASLEITAGEAVPVEKPALAMIRFKNVSTLFFKLVKPELETYSEKSGSAQPGEIFSYLVSLNAVKSWSQPIPSDGDFQGHSAEITIPGVPCGFYVLLCSTSEKFSGNSQVFAYAPFWSTQISYVSKRGDDSSLGYFLLDRETGAPLPHVRTEVWTKNWDYGARKNIAVKQLELTSDDNGFLPLPPVAANGPGTNIFLKIFYKEDFLSTDNFYRDPEYRSPERTSLQTLLFTDRAIYRPGQEIFFKGIILEKNGEKTVIKPKQPTILLFRDVNGQKVAELQLVSNEYGSFHGSFTAPMGVLAGQMTISNRSGSVSISVEEYKRPSFMVSYDSLEGNYKLDETVNVTGKATAFAGNGVDGAMVKYRVVRNARFPFPDWGWYRPMPVSLPSEIASGSLRTDPEGKFSFSFTAVPDPAVDVKSGPVFDYTLYTDVTDLNGETQSVQQDVSVGTQSLMLGINLSGMVNLAADTLLKITSTNLNGRFTPANVTISLSRLRQPGRLFRQRSWDRPDMNLLTADEFHAQFPNDIYGDENNPATWPTEAEVFEKTVNTGHDSLVNLAGKLSDGRAGSAMRPGSYLLTLKATDPFGHAVVKRQIFTAFSPVSKEVPLNAINWFVPLKTMGEPGESARFLIGSREENISVMYEIRHRDTLVSREWIRVGNRARILEIPITEQFRGNFSVNFVFVKHNRVYQNSQVVSVPYTNKKLDIAFETFRSNLYPGAGETWKIRITRPGGKPADAEFMAGMYDASLDQFRSNQWFFNLYQRYSGIYPWDVDHAFGESDGSGGAPPSGNEDYSSYPVIKLNWFGLNYFGGSGRNIMYSRLGSVNKGVKFTAPVVAEDEAVMTVSANEIEKKEEAPTGEAAKKPQPVAQMPLQVRRDFRETAFFYPSIVTDSTGSLILQFTAPESLTKWKLMGLAHSKNLEYGLVEKEVFTRKDLMVFPNAPRFVRQGDTVVFTTKISNLSGHDLTGRVTLSLSDAVTLQPISNLVDTTGNNNPGHPFSGQHAGFTLKTGESARVSWKLIIPVNAPFSLLQYRVTAVAGSYSDGEEKAIPVLTNRMLVTESLPLPVRGKGTTEFSFDRLLKSSPRPGAQATLKNYKVTLEFASNPAWYAVQALPSFDDRQFDNADAIFDGYWSNSMAAFIANSNPKIRAVFESWKSLTPDALQSNLAKNQQLKSALLQETPWVAEAASETGRKQKLGLYFDLNNIQANLKENLKKLRKLQSPNGGWSWFPGMPENRYTTQNILTGLGRLYHLGIVQIVKDEETREMLTKAIAYLDGELVADYENLKKYNAGKLADIHPGSSQVQYLYARSYFMTGTGAGQPGKAQGMGFSIPDTKPGFKEAFGYYQEQAAKYWLQNDRSLQGMIALALNRLGNREIPQLILKSLSEKALHSPEMGMYWSADPGYYWYQAPVETHALLMEAFDEIAQNQPVVEELKIWLLKQKQTQDWRSPRATLEACYALLLRGTDLLSEDPGVKISLGKEKITSDKLTDVKKEAGTGYFQCSWSGSEIKPEMGNITVTKSTPGIAWGAVYWQYFENLDKITPAATPLKLEKRLFLERITPSGAVLEPVTNEVARGTIAKGPSGMIKTGDKMVVRIVLTADRDLEFVHMKDLRASAFEPVIQGAGSGEGLSGYHFQDGLGYYQSTTDQATNFFFDYLPKGTYVFEYPLRANAAGEYSNGITTVQCLYAPEFTAHSEGIRVTVK